MKKNDLKERLEEYAVFLERKIGEEQKMANGAAEETLAGMILAEQRRRAYIDVKSKFYELFLELRKR